MNLADEDEDEQLDPNHNKGLVIEILDKKGKAAAKKQEVSLAEMFKAKKKDLAEKSASAEVYEK